MEAEVHKVPLHEIQGLRDLSLRENNFQFVHDKCHGAGWADTYIFSMGKDTAGYGSVDTSFKRNSSNDEGPEYVLEHAGQIVAS